MSTYIDHEPSLRTFFVLRREPSSDESFIFAHSVITGLRVMIYNPVHSL